MNNTLTTHKATPTATPHALPADQPATPVGATKPLPPPRPKPIVDLGTRLMHASMAATFALSYLTSESEYWRLVHVYSGYTLAAILLCRLIWGFVGPTNARWRFLHSRLGLWHVWWDKLQKHQWLTRAFWISLSSWLLQAAVFLIYTFCVVAIASGWVSYQEFLGDGLLNDILKEMHEILGKMALLSVFLHIGLVCILRIWRGAQATRPMWRGYANPAG